MHYSGSNGSHPFSKKGARSNESRALEELNDDSSEIQLRPIPVDRETRISADTNRNAEVNQLAEPGSITVQKKWEVKSEE
jgi:hypothetical protein